MTIWEILLLTVTAWAISAALTPLAMSAARRLSFLDRPAAHKFHREATPLLGGLALALGTLVPLLGRGDLMDRRFAAFLAAAVLLFLAGLWDDRWHLSVTSKLVAQAVAAILLLGGGFRAALPLPEWAVLLISFLWIVGLINAVNLLDSIDGAAAGVTAVAALAFLALGAGSPLALALAAALCGASLGFLLFNFHPARIFMGDAGSLFLGLALATLGLESRFGGVDPRVGWMLPVLLCAVPIFDTTLVVWSRLRRGRNPMISPGKDHFAHRLSRQGLGTRGAVLGLYVLGMLGAVLAGAILRGGLWMACGIGLSVFVAAAVAFARLERADLLGADLESAG